MSALVLDGIAVRYGGVDALAGVSLRVEPGAILGLIGPNGAGKTTLVNAASGFAALAKGSIRLDERRIDGLRPSAIARLGVLRTYQNIRLFGALTIGQNVRAGAYRTSDPNEDTIRKLLASVGLADHDLRTPAGTLAYGDQRRLEIARALAGEPGILMLDEPAAGMNHVEAQSLGEIVRAIARSGIGVLLIEHNVALVRAISDRVVVLNFGTMLAEGTAEEVTRDPAVIDAYLGSPV